MFHQRTAVKDRTSSWKVLFKEMHSGNKLNAVRLIKLQAVLFAVACLIECNQICIVLFHFPCPSTPLLVRFKIAAINDIVSIPQLVLTSKPFCFSNNKFQHFEVLVYLSNSLNFCSNTSSCSLVRLELPFSLPPLIRIFFAVYRCINSASMFSLS